MGMGYGAGYADVVTENFVKKNAPKEFRLFQKALEEFEIDIEQFASAIEFNDQNYYLESLDDPDKAEKAMPKIWKKLQKAFHINTGLNLFLGFHDSNDDGDRYDDVNGAYWCVSGAWTMTPAGKKFQRSIKRAFFVTFG